MVATITINPLLEYRLYFNKIDIGTTNKSFKYEITCGGKGINVSRQLNLLNVKNVALTLLGGNNGKILRRQLEKEKINFSVVSVKDETRFASLIIEEDSQTLTTLFSPNSSFESIEVENFIEKLEKIIKNNSVIVFSGSSPNANANKIFPAGIELAHKYDKISILDTYGDHLKDCLSKGPTVYHGNVKEISGSLKINLNDEKSKIDFLNELYGKGIKLAFITDGANAAYVSKFDFHYKIENPEIKEIDATGSGDAFIAGIAYGLENSLVYEEFVKLASALGVANATKWEVCNSTLKEANKFIDKIKLFPIGKKMKIIDDSPTI